LSDAHRWSSACRPAGPAASTGSPGAHCHRCPAVRQAGGCGRRSVPVHPSGSKRRPGHDRPGKKRFRRTVEHGAAGAAMRTRKPVTGATVMAWRGGEPHPIMVTCPRRVTVGPSGIRKRQERPLPVHDRHDVAGRLTTAARPRQGGDGTWRQTAPASQPPQIELQQPGGIEPGPFAVPAGRAITAHRCLHSRSFRMLQRAPARGFTEIISQNARFVRDSCLRPGPSGRILARFGTPIALNMVRSDPIRAPLGVRSAGWAPVPTIS